MRFWSLGGKRVLALVTRTLGFFHLSCKRNWYSFLRIHKETEAPFREQHGEAVTASLEGGLLSVALLVPLDR